MSGDKLSLHDRCGLSKASIALFGWALLLSQGEMVLYCQTIGGVVEREKRKQCSRKVSEGSVDDFEVIDETEADDMSMSRSITHQVWSSVSFAIFTVSMALNETKKVAIAHAACDVTRPGCTLATALQLRLEEFESVYRSLADEQKPNELYIPVGETGHFKFPWHKKSRDHSTYIKVDFNAKKITFYDPKNRLSLWIYAERKTIMRQLNEFANKIWPNDAVTIHSKGLAQQGIFNGVQCTYHVVNAICNEVVGLTAAARTGAFSHSENGDVVIAGEIEYCVAPASEETILQGINKKMLSDQQDYHCRSTNQIQGDASAGSKAVPLRCFSLMGNAKPNTLQIFKDQILTVIKQYQEKHVNAFTYYAGTRLFGAKHGKQGLQRAEHFAAIIKRTGSLQAVENELYRFIVLRKYGGNANEHSLRKMLLDCVAQTNISGLNLARLRDFSFSANRNTYYAARSLVTG